MIKSNMSSINQQQEMIDRFLYSVNTCLPGIIQAFYPDSQTVAVIPAIKTMVRDVNGNDIFVEMPEILEVPICFPFAATLGFALTMPVQAGDSCVLVFSQRAIENWQKLGGIQPPDDNRHHNLYDAFAFMAAPTIPQALSDWLMDGMEIRNRDRSSRISVKNGQTEIMAGASGITTNGAGTSIAGAVQTDSHVEVGTGASGVFVDALGAVITVQNGIIIGGLD